MKINLQFFGGRGGGSGMSSSTSGGSYMSDRQNMEDYAIATGALDIGSEEETRAFLKTAEGRAALDEFMNGEREAGLTEAEMREAIKSTGSDRSAPPAAPTAPGRINLNSGDKYMDNENNMVKYALATGALDIGSERETKAFLKTAEGKSALKEFMQGEIEAGLTGSEMKNVINSVRRRRR